MMDANMGGVSFKSAGIAAARQHPHGEVLEAFDSAHDLARRVANLAERLVGAQPEVSKADTKPSICGGLLGDIATQAEGVKDHVGHALRMLDRIEAQLP